jgi:hypothetical protein
VLTVATCLMLCAVPPPRAQPIAALPGDASWTVPGPEIPGTRSCGHWLVRLTNANGRLTGVLSLARGSAPIENLSVQPDGTFAGATRARLVGPTLRVPTESPAVFPATASS